MTVKPLTWEAKGVPHYTASGFGGCLKSLVASRMGYDQVPPPETLQKIFDAGHQAEDDCLRVLRAAGMEIVGQQREIELHVAGVVIQGHIDGIFEFEQASDRAIMEVKSQGSSSWDAYEKGERGSLWERYKWQASVYMHALQLPLIWVRWHREVELDQAPLYSLHRLETPPYSLEDIARRVEAVETFVRKDTLPPCVEQSWGCPFYYLHEDDEEEVAELHGIEDLAAHYHEAREKELAAKKEKEEVREYIMKLLASQELKRAKEGLGKAVISDGTRVTFDEDAMIADGINIEKYKIVKGYQTLRVQYKAG